MNRQEDMEEDVCPKCGGSADGPGLPIVPGWYCAEPCHAGPLNPVDDTDTPWMNKSAVEWIMYGHCDCAVCRSLRSRIEAVVSKLSGP